MNPYRQAVAAEVRAAVGRAGLKQWELADRITMSRPALSLRLSGHRPFSTDQLFEIAEVLGVDTLSLMRTPDPEKSA